MTNYRVSIPVGMTTKKFYCHKCGEQFGKHAKTRTVRRGDPDYKKYSRMHRIHIIDDVQVTEYDFKCPTCGNIIEYDEQCVINKIQKQLDTNLLSEADIFENREKIEKFMDRNVKVRKVISTVLALLVVALILYFQYKSGNFSFRLYF